MNIINHIGMVMVLKK